MQKPCKPQPSFENKYIIFAFSRKSNLHHITMTKIGKFILLLAAIVSSQFIQAQTNFESEADLIKQADKLFNNSDYATAQPLYSQLLSTHPNEGDYLFKYGTCLLFMESDKERSLKYLEGASRSPKVDYRVFYYAAKNLHLLYKFDDALKMIDNYLSKVPAEKEDALTGNWLKNRITKAKSMYLEGTQKFIPESITEGLENEFYRQFDLSSLKARVIPVPATFKTDIDNKKNFNTYMVVGPEFQTVYYSSYGEEGKNGKDIYSRKKLPNGEWGMPILLNSTVNTAYDEDFPFFSESGSTLYFTSNSDKSVGGNDIFKSFYDTEKGEFGQPSNMGFPINSPDEDFFFITDFFEDYVWFASKRDSKPGYTKVFKKLQTGTAKNYVIINGVYHNVSDTSQKKNSIRAYVKKEGELVGVFNSNVNNGKYLIALPAGNEYSLSYEPAGAAPQTFDLAATATMTNKVLNQEISFEANAQGEKIKVKDDKLLSPANPEKTGFLTKEQSAALLKERKSNPDKFMGSAYSDIKPSSEGTKANPGVVAITNPTETKTAAAEEQEAKAKIEALNKALEAKKLAAAEKEKTEQEAKVKMEAERVALLAKVKAEQEAQAKAETERKALEAKQQADATKLKAEQEAKVKAEAERKALEANQQADAAKLKAEQEAQAKAEIERKALEAKQQADAAKLKAEQDAKAKAKTESKSLETKQQADVAKLKAEQEAKVKAEAERKALEAKQQADAVKLKAEQESKAKAETERKALEAKQQADAAKLKAEQEAKVKAEAERKALEAKQQADAAKLKAEQEAKVKAEGERKALEAKQQADAAKLKAEQESKVKAEAERIAFEAKQQADAAKLKAEQEAKVKAEGERKALEAKQQADAAKLKAEQESKVKAEAERKALEAKQQADAAKLKAEQEAQANKKLLVQKTEQEVRAKSLDKQKAQDDSLLAIARSQAKAKDLEVQVKLENEKKQLAEINKKNEVETQKLKEQQAAEKAALSAEFANAEKQATTKEKTLAKADIQKVEAFKEIIPADVKGVSSEKVKELSDLAKRNAQTVSEEVLVQQIKSNARMGQPVIISQETIAKARQQKEKEIFQNLLDIAREEELTEKANSGDKEAAKELAEDKDRKNYVAKLLAEKKVKEENMKAEEDLKSKLMAEQEAKLKEQKLSADTEKKNAGKETAKPVVLIESAKTKQWVEANNKQVAKENNEKIEADRKATEARKAAEIKKLMETESLTEEEAKADIEERARIAAEDAENEKAELEFENAKETAFQDSLELMDLLHLRISDSEETLKDSISNFNFKAKEDGLAIISAKDSVAILKKAQQKSVSSERTLSDSISKANKPLFARLDDPNAHNKYLKNQKLKLANKKTDAEKKSTEAKHLADAAKLKATQEATAIAEAEKKAAETKLKTEQDAKLKAETEKKAAEAKQLADAAKLKAKQEAAAKLEADKKAAEAKLKAEQDAKIKLETEKKATEAKQLADAAKLKAKQEAAAKLEADKKAAEAKLKAEQDAKIKLETEKKATEAKQLANAAKLKATQEATAKAEAEKKANEAKLKAEQDAKLKAETEKKAAEAKQLADAAKLKATQEATAKLAAEKKAAEAKLKADAAKQSANQILSENQIATLAKDSASKLTYLSLADHVRKGAKTDKPVLIDSAKIEAARKEMEIEFRNHFRQANTQLALSQKAVPIVKEEKSKSAETTTNVSKEALKKEMAAAEAKIKAKQLAEEKAKAKEAEKQKTLEAKLALAKKEEEKKQALAKAKEDAEKEKMAAADIKKLSELVKESQAVAQEAKRDVNESKEDRKKRELLMRIAAEAKAREIIASEIEQETGVMRDEANKNFNAVAGILSKVDTTNTNQNVVRKTMTQIGKLSETANKSYAVIDSIQNIPRNKEVLAHIMKNEKYEIIHSLIDTVDFLAAENVMYRVELSFADSKIPAEVLPYLNQTTIQSDANGKLNLTTGWFLTLSDATRLQHELNWKGIDSANILAFYKGENISFTKARKLTLDAAKH